jgi:predicted transcriptional regulator
MTDARQYRSKALGQALRRWRTLNRVKQIQAAERLNVAQSTLCRWERGSQQMGKAEQARVEEIVSARLDCAADRELAKLISIAPLAMHLVCDQTHVLLACSDMSV